MRIIVVDDEKDIRDLLETALKSKGHEVQTYADPTEFPFLHKNNCPCPPQDPCADAIIADIVMPKVEGIDFVKLLRDAGCWPLTRGNVAIISGYLTLHYMNELNRLGIQYFRKPFELAEIYQWIAECEQRLTSPPGSLPDSSA